MIFNDIIPRLEALQREAPAFEAKHLFGNLIVLLTQQRSNKMSPVAASVLKRKPTRVLDIGCGCGALVIFFAMHGIDVTGIDLDPAGLEACEKLSASLNLQNIALAPMDACAITLTGFDCAFSTDFYEHLPHEMQPVHLRSIHHALKPGGTYIIRTPHRSNIRQHRDGHIGLPSFGMLRQQAGEAGFSVRFGIAHTSLVSPVSYQVPLERWLESRNWSSLALYKGLQKCGLANVLAYLRKEQGRGE